MTHFTHQPRLEQPAGTTARHAATRQRRGDGNTAVVVIAVVLGVVLIIGLVRGWFAFAATPDEVEPETKTEVSMTVDKARMERDMEAAGDAASEAAEEVAETAKDASEAGKEIAEIETVRGEIVEIEGMQISLMPDDAEEGQEPLTMVADADSEIETVDGEVGQLKDFKVGDKATAVYNEETKPFPLKRLVPVEDDSGEDPTPDPALETTRDE